MGKIAVTDSLLRIDPTEGSIFKALVINVVPMWVGSALYLLLYLWELYVVGGLGTENIAALAVSEASIMIFWTVIPAISNTAIALVGNLAGKKELEKADETAKEIVSFCFMVCFFLALTGYAFGGSLLSALGAKQEVIQIAIPYLHTVMLGGTISFPMYVITSILRARGEVAVPAGIVYGTIVLNALALLPLFLKIQFFVNMGLVWVAYAYTISNGLGTLFALFFLYSGSRESLKVKLPKPKTIIELIRLAGINTIEMLFMSVVSIIMVRLVAEWGTFGLAAYEIGQRLFMASMLWGFDIATVSNILVANNLGAKKEKRAERSAWLSCGMNIMIVGSAGLMILAFSESVISIFDKGKEVIELGKGYLRITVPGWPFVAAWTILRRSFIGAKDFMTPLLISLLTAGGLQLPLAFLLSRSHTGIEGVWWAISVTYTVQGLASASVFKLGWWKKGKWLDQ